PSRSLGGGGKAGISGGGPDLLQVRFAEARVVAVEDMTEEAAVEIAGAEQPIGNGIGQVHVGAHHDCLIVMGDVMAPYRVHERDVADDPVILHMTAPVE